MASKPMWLRVLGGEAAKVLRGSDTIGWLTTDGAKALETHAKKRQDEMARVRDALASNSDRIPEFDRAVRFAEAESGRPGESHPRAPSDPGVTVSRHRALLTSSSGVGADHSPVGE
jgi:hypothetical protein